MVFLDLGTEAYDMSFIFENLDECWRRFWEKIDQVEMDGALQRQ